MPRGALQFLPGAGDGRRGAGRRSARRRRHVHRLDRGRAADPAAARHAAVAGRPADSADRRDRRPERHDRRFLGADRAGGAAMCWPRPSTAPASAARPCACSACRRTSPTGRSTMLKGAMRELRDRQSGPARDRCRPGDQPRKPRQHRRATSMRCGAQGPHGHAGAAARRGHRRHLRRADPHRARRARRTAARSVRPGAACGALSPRRSRPRWSMRINATRLWPDLRPAHPHRRDHRPRHRAHRASAISMSTATSSAPWSACSPSAATASPAPGPRPAARSICAGCVPHPAARRAARRRRLRPGTCAAAISRNWLDGHDHTAAAAAPAPTRRPSQVGSSHRTAGAGGRGKPLRHRAARQDPRHRGHAGRACSTSSRRSSRPATRPWSWSKTSTEPKAPAGTCHVLLRFA